MTKLYQLLRAELSNPPASTGLQPAYRSIGVRGDICITLPVLCYWHKRMVTLLHPKGGYFCLHLSHLPLQAHTISSPEPIAHSYKSSEPEINQS